MAIHVADPAEAAALRGNKRRAKTDRLDARRLREILENGQIPESWIPPAFVLEVRTKARLYKDLLDLKAAWQHRIHATMFHQGVPKATGGLLRKGRAQAGRDDSALSPAGRQAIDVALTLIAALDAQLVELRAELVAFGRSHPGPIALSHEYGLGPLLATIVWEEMGDTRRFSASGTRSATPDWTSPSTPRTASDYGARGSPSKGLRCCAGRCLKRRCTRNKQTSPDHDYYLALVARIGRGRMTLARKLARRCHHRLRDLGDRAFTETTIDAAA